MTDTNNQEHASTHDRIVIRVDLLDNPKVELRENTWTQIPDPLLLTYDLTWEAKGLWQILHRHAGLNRDAHPGRQRLAELMNMTDRTVTKYLKELTDQGWLRIDNSKNVEGKPSQYTLCVPAAYDLLMPTYPHGTAQVEVKPKEKLADKPRAAIENPNENDSAPRYAISYNHTREFTPTPLDVRKKAELSQKAYRDQQGKQLPPKQAPKALPGIPTQDKWDLMEEEWERENQS